MNIKNKKELHELLEKGPYTSVGCYPLFFMAQDCSTLCFRCVQEHENREREEWEPKREDEEEDRQWKIVACDVNYESLDYCEECGEQIETAYGVWTNGEESEE